MHQRTLPPQEALAWFEGVNMDEQRELDRPELDITGVISDATWAREEGQKGD